MNAFEETDDNCMNNCKYCQKDKIYDCAKELAELEDNMNMVDSIYFDLLTTSIICSKCFTEEFSEYYSDDSA
jgi:hypothetical protein